MTYIEVLLPLALNGNLTYVLPPHLESKAGVGFRVIVPLGKKNKFYTGIIVSITTIAPQAEYELKEAVCLLDDFPIVIYPQLKLWEWISDYYLSSPGEVMKAALPSGLKVESETFVEIHPDYDGGKESLMNDNRLSLIISTIENRGRISVQEIVKITGLKNIGKEIANLLKQGIIIISERLQEKYHVKKQSYVELNGIIDSNNIVIWFEQVKGAPNQERLLQYIINLASKQQFHTQKFSIAKKELLDQTGIGVSSLDGLIKKGILCQFKKEINRFKPDNIVVKPLPTLTSFQRETLDNIKLKFRDNKILLLRGVTSSGKTEIYQYLIEDVLAENGQALFLVPEIALTTQLTKRLHAVFGDKLIIYHSKFSDAERVEIWLKLLRQQEPCVIIGARSSVFLPFSNLKLVIVDEEHETSYKQVEPAPRYNARDVAILLASMHGANTLLGSATPSVETYWKATTGKFGLIELTKRFNDVPLPPIELVNLTEAYKSQRMAGGFALRTLRYVKESVENGNQSIIFQNRRGFAPVARCKMCAWSPKCSQCDVALTYHKNINSLVCHYCGNQYPVPDVCPQCKEPAIEIMGYGTERIEEEVALRVPDVRIARLDLDTTRNKDSYSKIIDDFSEHKTDVLVGTQMVTKGLDFGNVSTVVVSNADSLINYPDFRSSERAFNMLEQVAGRAGRREKNDARVIIQTYNSENNIFSFLINHDYVGFYKMEIEERKKFMYPPFCRIINIYIKHRDVTEVIELSRKYTSVLRTSFGDRVFGPDEPPVSKIQNLYIRRIMLKLETDIPLSRIKKYLKDVLIYMHTNGQLNNAVIYYDVDPV